MTIHPWNRTVWESLTAPRSRSNHAMLFVGPRGLGKTQCAMMFAGYLVGVEDNPRARTLFGAGTHPDVHVVAREIDVEEDDPLSSLYARRHVEERARGSKPKTVVTVGQIRRLIEALHTRAHSGRYKVALLLNAHMMNINAANALLKLLEEPPEDTVLVCTTDQPHRLPATVRSRCSIIGFAPPPRKTAVQWLSEQTDADSVEVALDLAGGAPLEALELIEKDRVDTRRKWLSGLAAFYSGRSDVASVAELGRQIGLAETLLLSQKLLIDLSRCRLGAAPERFFNSDKNQWLQKHAERLQLQETFDLIDAIGNLRQDVDGPLDANLLLEDTLIRMQHAVTGSTQD